MQKYTLWSALVIATLALGVTSCAPRAPQPVTSTVAAVAPTSTPLDESAYRKKIVDVVGSVSYTLNYVRRDVSRAADDPRAVEDVGWRRMWMEQSTTLREHAIWARTTTPPPDWQQFHSLFVQALDNFGLALDAVDSAVAAHVKGDDVGFKDGLAEFVTQIDAGYVSLDAARLQYDERMP